MAGSGRAMVCMEITGEGENMKKQTYQYAESPFNVSRREFITIGGIIIALLALPAVWIRSGIAKRNSYIRARTKGLYTDDTQSKVRVSHGNTAVAKMYTDFAQHPLSEISEELFHTHHYINRRAA